MKRIFKRNQLIITALAIMIAVAGYLNFVDDKTTEDVNANIKSTTSTEKTTKDVSDETVGIIQEESDDLLNSSEDIESLDSDATVSDDSIAEGETSQPGEAVLVNASGTLTFVNEAKLNREQVRAKSKETLMEIINNANVSDAQKQEAITSLISITQISEKEAAAEMLLAAKGFDDSVVSITNNTADVIINLTNISDVQRAQIEDVIKSKTGVEAKNITITPINNN